MNVFVLLNTNEDILKNVGNRAVLGHHCHCIFFSIMEVNGAHKQPGYKLSSKYLALRSVTTHRHSVRVTALLFNETKLLRGSETNTRRNKRSTPCKNSLHLLFFFSRYMTNVFFIIVYCTKRRSVHPSSEGILTSSKLLNRRLLTLCSMLDERLPRGNETLTWCRVWMAFAVLTLHCRAKLVQCETMLWLDA